MINLLPQITANYFLAKPRATGIYVKMEVREHIFVPLGNGKMLKVIAIQSEHCAPFAEAVKQGLKSDH